MSFLFHVLSPGADYVLTGNLVCLATAMRLFA
jgi:hypothetical protein